MIDPLPTVSSPAASEAMEELRAALAADVNVGEGTWATRVVRDDTPDSLALTTTPEIHVAPVREVRSSLTSGEAEVTVECVVIAVYQAGSRVIAAGESGWEVVAQALFTAIERAIPLTKAIKLPEVEAAALPGEAYGLSKGMLCVQVPVNLNYLADRLTGERT